MSNDGHTENEGRNKIKKRSETRGTENNKNRLNELWCRS